MPKLLTSFEQVVDIPLVEGQSWRQFSGDSEANANINDWDTSTRFLGAFRRNFAEELQDPESHFECSDPLRAAVVHVMNFRVRLIARLMEQSDHLRKFQRHVRTQINRSDDPMSLFELSKAKLEEWYIAYADNLTTQNSNIQDHVPADDERIAEFTAQIGKLEEDIRRLKERVRSLEQQRADTEHQQWEVAYTAYQTACGESASKLQEVEASIFGA